MDNISNTIYIVISIYGSMLARIVLFVVILILLLEMIKFFKKLNGISFYDVRNIIRMARDEFREPNRNSEED